MTAYVQQMSHAALIEDIEAWLIDKALGDPDIVQLFQRLCERLLGSGVPVQRAALSWPTLHPLFWAEQIFWNDQNGAHLEQHSHTNRIPTLGCAVRSVTFCKNSSANFDAI